MQKSIRTLALTLALTFAAVPMIHADRMGTNPPPQFDAMANVVLILQAAMSVYGM